MRLPRFGAVPRMTVGLVSLAVMLLLVFDVVFDLFPNEQRRQREVDAQVAGQLAVQTAALLQSRDWRALDQTLHGVRTLSPGIDSLGVRRADGALVAQAGAHPAHWPAAGRGRGHDVTVVLTADGRRWGQLEVAHRAPALAAAVAGELGGPVRLALLFGVVASLLYYLYLRRMLEHLDPSRAIPDRVRSAFDTLVEGVMVVDTRGRVLLVNKVLEALRPDAGAGSLVGRPAAAMAWLQPAEPGVPAAPWLAAMQHRQALRGLSFVVRDGADAEPRAHLVLNCSPLLDEQGGLRGCLVSVGDVSELELSHRQLLDVLADLAMSKQELEASNHELAQLASQDVLSGCLNRRALFELGEALLRRAARDGTPLVCVMADIDHFKKINDTWGHAVGDQAIQRFAAILRQHVRPGDLLGRYGGEEFCLLLHGATVERGRDLAEQLRAAVADNRGAGFEPGAPVVLSASFGVAALVDGQTDLGALIDLADRAMYVAKKTGRNRVVVHDASMNAAPGAAPGDDDGRRQGVPA